MRIILKPGGILLITTALFCLAGTVLLPMRQSASPASAAPGRPSGADQLTAGVASPPHSSLAEGGLCSEETWRFYTENGGKATTALLSESDLPARPAHHFEVQQIGSSPWNVGFNNGLIAPVAPGTRLRLHFWGRSSSRLQICTILQRNVPPYPHAWKQYLTLTPDWKEYDITFVCTESYAPGEAILSFFLGFNTGSIDLAGIRLEKA